MTPCRRPLATGGTCAISDGHRGRHTAVAFLCDGCGLQRPGRPAEIDWTGVGVYDPDDVEPVRFCFTCAAATRRRAIVKEIRP